MHCVAFWCSVLTVICASSIKNLVVFVKSIEISKNKNNFVRFIDMFSAFFIYTSMQFSGIFFYNKAMRNAYEPSQQKGMFHL